MLSLFALLALAAPIEISGATLLSEGFEGPGYENNGWIVPPNSSSPPNPDYSATPLVGAQSLRCNGVSFIQRPFVNSTAFYCYFQARWLGWADFKFIVDWLNASQSSTATLVTDTGRRIAIIHGGVVATGTTVINDNTTYHIWVEWGRNSGAADGTMRLYVSTTGIKPASPEAVISNGQGEAVALFDVGPFGAGADVIYDNVLISDAPIGSNPASNLPPSISDIANQTILHDTTLGPLNFTIGDPETPAAELTVSADSSNPLLVPGPNISLGGAGTTRTISVAPAAGQNGNSTITVSVSDGTNTASDTFLLTVTSGANTPPTISDLPNQTIGEGGILGPISFAVGDAETAVGSLVVTASSSNLGLVPDANITLSGSGATRSITVAPAANQSGNTIITVTVSDGEASASDTFILTVNPSAGPGTFVLDEAFEGPGYENAGWSAGTGLPNPDYTAFPLEGDQSLFLASGSSINRVFTLTTEFNLYARVRWPDLFTQFSSLFQWWTPSFGNQVASVATEFGDRLAINHGTAAATAVIPTIVPNRTYHVWVEWTRNTGATDGTMRLYISENDNKPATPQASLSAGSGADPALLVVGPYAGGAGMIVDTLLVSDAPIGSNPGGNADPNISDIPTQSILPDTTLGPVSFIIGDAETPATSLTVTASSSNLDLVPESAISLGGADATRTITISPAAGQTGSAIITVTVSDGTNSASDTFTLNVNSGAGVPEFVLDEAFEGPGYENPGWSAGTGLPDPDYFVFPLEGAESLFLASGSSINRVFTLTTEFNLYARVRWPDFFTQFSSMFQWWTPSFGNQVAGVATEFGNRLAITHGTTAATAVIPTITPDTTYHVWVEWTRNTGAGDGTMRLYISEDDNKPATPQASLSSGSGMDPALLVVGPYAGGAGMIIDTLLVSDAPIGSNPGGGNSPPTITAIGPQTTDEDTPTVAIAFTVDDPETGPDSLNLQATSSNTALIPEANIVFGGSGSSRTVTITPSPDQSGAADITISVSDGELASSTMFTLSVNAIPDIPVVTWANPASIIYGTPLGAGQLNATASVAGSFTYNPLAGTILNAGLGQTLSVTFNPNDTANYLPATANVTVDVLRAPLSITAANQTRSYASANPPLTAIYVGFVNGDDGSSLDNPVTLTTSAAASSLPGIYPISAAGAADANYIIAHLDGTLTITAWQHQDVGSVALAGDAIPTADTYTLKGSGVDIWDLADGFHFLYRPWTGNGEIIARVTSVGNTDPWAKAGVMFRETLTTDSRHAMMVITPGNGSAFQRRLATGVLSTHTPGPVVTAPYWVRLLRIGDTFQGYISADGIAWSFVGSDTVPMGSSIYVGLAVTAHNNTVLNTSTFTSVQTGVPAPPPTITVSTPANGTTFFAPTNISIAADVAPNGAAIAKVQFHRNEMLLGEDLAPPYDFTWNAAPVGNHTLTARAVYGNGLVAISSPVSITVISPLPAPWLHQDIGAVALAGDATYAGDTYTVKASGVDIWDLADGFHFVYQTWTGNGEIIARVTSVGNTDPWAKAGVMFRDSLTTDSRHAMMVVTPGNGAAFQRRLTTGGSSTHTAGPVVTAPQWVRLVRIGDTFQGYISANGTSWVLVGSDTVPMTAPVYVGLAVTAHNNGVLNTSTFASVQTRVPALAPAITITTPTNGSFYVAPASGVIAANVTPNGFSISKVQLFVNGFFAGEDSLPPYNFPVSSVPAGNYVLLARAIYGSSLSVTSSPVNVTVVSPPATPVNVRATAISGSQINLSWTAGSASHTGFRIERSLNGTTFTPLATTAAGTTTYNNTGLAPGTIYYYRIAATNALASSSYSAIVSARTFLPLIRINFQPASSSVPAGYLPDAGAVFGNRGNGYSYGWNVNNSSTARDRNSSRSPDQRYDTLQHMQVAASTWEIAVPNGSYSVFLVAGDPDNYDSKYRINVEGVSTVSGNPNSSTRWVSGTKTVTVSDGRLSVKNGSSASNNKICFIEITQVQPPEAMFMAASAVSLPWDAPIQIEWLGRDAFGRVTVRVFGPADGTYSIETSTDLRTWSPLETVPDSEGTLSFEDPDSQSSPQRFFRAVLQSP